MSVLKCLVVGMSLVLLAACVPTRQVRTEYPTAAAQGNQDGPFLSPPTIQSGDCSTGSEQQRENRQVIEDYGQYLLGFAEFDDQGWSYDRDGQLAALQDRLHSELNDPKYSDQDFVIIVFVHGWHHNAHDNDCNVQEARQMVRLAAQQFDQAADDGKLRKRRVFGIYVGWRGESVDGGWLRYTTVLDRRNAAEKVAKGSIRQLFANLHEEERAARAAAADRTPESQLARMYTNVVGHSFGGLIVFNSLSQQLINNLTTAAADACRPDNSRKDTDSFPDKVLLINPAFEASRFEPLNRLADRAAACGYKAKHPAVIVVTADNDHWTGSSFTFGRQLLTVFDKYDDATPVTRATERNANLRAIGFVDRYRTHRLCMQPGSTDEPVVAAQALTQVSTADPRFLADRAVWVIGAPAEIVDGHNGFLFARPGKNATPQANLLNWLAATHIRPDKAMSHPDACGGWGH